MIHFYKGIFSKIANFPLFHEITKTVNFIMRMLKW